MFFFELKNSTFQPLDEHSTKNLLIFRILNISWRDFPAIRAFVSSLQTLLVTGASRVQQRGAQDFGGH